MTSKSLLSRPCPANLQRIGNPSKFLLDYLLCKGKGYKGCHACSTAVKKAQSRGNPNLPRHWIVHPWTHRLTNSQPLLRPVSLVGKYCLYSLSQAICLRKGSWNSISISRKIVLWFLWWHMHQWQTKYSFGIRKCCQIPTYLTNCNSSSALPKLSQFLKLGHRHHAMTMGYSETATQHFFLKAKGGTGNLDGFEQLAKILGVALGNCQAWSFQRLCHSSHALHWTTHEATLYFGSCLPLWKAT